MKNVTTFCFSRASNNDSCIVVKYTQNEHENKQNCLRYIEQRRAETLQQGRMTDVPSPEA